MVHLFLFGCIAHAGWIGNYYLGFWLPVAGLALWRVCGAIEARCVRIRGRDTRATSSEAEVALRRVLSAHLIDAASNGS